MTGWRWILAALCVSALRCPAVHAQGVEAPELGVVVPVDLMWVAIATSALVVVMVLLLLDNRARKRTVAAVQASERRYRLLAETGTSVIGVHDAKSRFTYVSPSCEQLFGYRPDQLIGRRADSLLHPDDLPAARAQYRDVLATGQGRRLRCRIVRADGTIVWADSHGRVPDEPIVGPSDAVYTVTRDITAEMQAEADLKATTDLYRGIFDDSAAVLLLVDPNTHIIIAANRAAKAYYGYGEFLVGMRVSEINTLTATELTAEIAKARAGQQNRFEFRHRLASGDVRDVEIYSNLVSYAGRRIIFSIIHDITARKQAEDLREAVERITRHDLKSPVIAGLSGVESLRMANNLNAEQVETLDLMEAESRRMLDMLNMSLVLYRIETGTFQIKAEPVLVRPAINDVFRELDMLVAARQAVMDIDVPFDLAVSGEPGLCRTLFANLIRNALEALPAQGETVSVRAREADGMVHTAIRNPGEVPADIRARFFERYTTSGKEGGTGLGTYSAQLMTRAQGGEITLDTSEPGATTVTVSLPVAGSGCAGAAAP